MNNTNAQATNSVAIPNNTGATRTLECWKEFEVGASYEVQMWRRFWSPETNAHSSLGHFEFAGKLVQIQEIVPANQMRSRNITRPIDRFNFIFEVEEEDDNGNSVKSLLETCFTRHRIISAWRLFPKNAFGPDYEGPTGYCVFDQTPK
jgi:hypothetical protein